MPVADAFGADVPVVVEQGGDPDGRAWLATLPEVVASLERDWGLTTGQPFLGGSASWVAPAVTADGGDAVLKVNLPHREAREEATALDAWDSRGAVRLLRSDRERGALLIERCRPGAALHQSGLTPDVALGHGARVLVQLWSAPVLEPSTFERLGDVTAEWAGGVRERMDRCRPPLDGSIVELGAALLETLPTTATRTVIVHGDFNPGNVLSSARDGWLAIDAKPMVGDPGYDPPPLVGQIEDPFPWGAAVVCNRYRLLADETGEPLDRLLAWAVARHVEWALWHVDRAELTSAIGTIDSATLLARLAGL